MTRSSDAAFARALRLPSAPLLPRPASVSDLRARVHRRVGLEAPADVTPMRKAAGLEYEVGGNPDGEAVLFMHAGTAHRVRAPDAGAGAGRSLPTRPVPPPRIRGQRRTRWRGQHRPYTCATRSRCWTTSESSAPTSSDIPGAGSLRSQLALDAPAGRSVVGARRACDPRDRPAVGRRHSRGHRCSRRTRFRSGDVRGAIEMWMGAISPSWRADLTRTVPGGPQQTLEDAAAFFAEVDAGRRVGVRPSARSRASRRPCCMSSRQEADTTCCCAVSSEVVPQTESRGHRRCDPHAAHGPTRRSSPRSCSAFFARHAERA